MDRPGLRGLTLVFMALLIGVGCTGKDEAKPNSSNDVQESSSPDSAPDIHSRGTSKPETSPSKTNESVEGLIGDLMGRPGTGKAGDPVGLAGVKLTGDSAADKAAIVKALESLQTEWKRTKEKYRQLADAKVPAGDPRLEALKAKNDALGKQADALQALLDKLADRGR